MKDDNVKKEKMEYQQFMSKNNIKEKDLPPLLRLLVKEMGNLLDKAQQSCDNEDCKLIHEKLMKYNDFILSEMYEFFSDRLMNNELNEKKEEEITPPLSAPVKKQKTDVELLTELDQKEQNIISDEKLRKLGLQHKLDEKYIQIKHFVLRFFSSDSVWLIENTKNKNA